MLDLAKRVGGPVTCITSNLESFYDRKLTNIGCIVEESIGLKRDAMELVTKVLPRCKHFRGTAHGVSKYCYGVINELLWSTGQGNVFSGSAWRDLSCFIFKEMEKKILGIMIASKNNNKEAQRVAM